MCTRTLSKVRCTSLMFESRTGYQMFMVKLAPRDRLPTPHPARAAAAVETHITRTTRLLRPRFCLFPCFCVVKVLYHTVMSMHHIVHPYRRVVDISVPLGLCRVILCLVECVRTRMCGCEMSVCMTDIEHECERLFANLCGFPTQSPNRTTTEVFATSPDIACVPATRSQLAGRRACAVIRVVHLHMCVVMLIYVY